MNQINQAYQAYKDTLAKIKKILSYEKDIRRTFSEQGAKKIKCALDLIEKQMEKVNKNEKVQASGEEKSAVKETVNLLLDIAIEKPITPIFRDLTASYLLLVFNWNQALGKRPDIEKNVKLIDMLVRGQLTMFETINVLKRILERTKASQRYQSPSFDLSRAYLDNLKKEIDGSACSVPKKGRGEPVQGGAEGFAIRKEPKVEKSNKKKKVKNKK